MAPTMENYTNFFFHSAVRAEKVGVFQKACNVIDLHLKLFGCLKVNNIFKFTVCSRKKE